MIPSGTDHGTDPRTPRNVTRIGSRSPRGTLVRGLHSPRELPEQILRASRILCEHVPHALLRAPPQLRVGGRDHRRRAGFVEEEVLPPPPFPGPEGSQRNGVRPAPAATHV